MSDLWPGRLEGIFFGLNTSHTYAHMTRSVMEGVAFALKESVNIINQSSESPSKYIVTGGGAKVIYG